MGTTLWRQGETVVRDGVQYTLLTAGEIDTVVDSELDGEEVAARVRRNLTEFVESLLIDAGARVGDILILIRPAPADGE